ncbi:hypothetical protein WKW77_20355 [Variovorax ureilyticus]|uniref:Uncharacterized protein n=1 Tax=Variovorax ureilyticus TaxID=1836198 RepID=A0ABU8VIF5_9BURK
MTLLMLTPEELAALRRHETKNMGATTQAKVGKIDTQRSSW